MKLPSIPVWLTVFSKHIPETLKEFSFFVFFALMPIWVAVVARAIGSVPILEFLDGYLTTGEAALISATSIGPLVYFLQKEYGKGADGRSRAFPLKNFFLLAIVLICIVCAIIVTMQTLKEDLSSVIWWISSIIVALSVCMWLIITTIRNGIDDAAPKMNRAEEQDFLDRWGEK
jgi:hypothetical protein